MRQTAGSVYRRADGRWVAAVHLGRDPTTGRRRRRILYGKTKAEAVRKLRAAHVELDKFGDIPGRPPTVEAWLTRWLDTVAAERVRPSTLAGYRSKVRTYLIPLLGRYRLDQLQPDHLRAAYVAMREQGLSPATILQTHRILSRALVVAVRDGRINRNVATLVDAPSVDHVEISPLSAVEAWAILAAAHGTRLESRWHAALLGLRQGEALGLRWGDVDLDAGTLTVRTALQRITGRGLVLVQPKSRAGRRTVILTATMLRLLRTRREAYLSERAHGLDRYMDWQLVWGAEDGRPIDPRTDWAHWKDLLAAAGVRDVRLHDARHTGATLMLAEGVPARVAMQVLGHSQIGLTLGTYSHVTPELSQAAADALERALTAG